MNKNVIIIVLSIALVLSIVYGQIQRSEAYNVRKVAEKNLVEAESHLLEAEKQKERANRAAADARKMERMAMLEKDAADEARKTALELKAQLDKCK